METTQARKLVSDLFDEWYAPLVQYCARVRHSTELAEEAVQEAFLALFRELVAGKEIRNPRGWTLCVVRRELLRKHRAAALMARTALPLSEVAEPAEPAREPDAWKEGDLTELLMVLTQREREVILLRTRTLKYREIGVELGISTNSVRTLMARALRKLHQAANSARFERRPEARLDDEDHYPATLQ